MNKAIKIQSPEHKLTVEKLLSNMILLGKVCLPNMFSVKSPDAHFDMARVLTNQALRKVVIVASRGLAKSSIAACLLVLWHIFSEDKPKVIVLISRTLPHTIRLLTTIKNALDYSAPLRAIFGYWGEHSAKSWTQTEICLKDGTLIVCRGTGQQIVGLKHGNQRPTLIILDDPEDMENTKTIEAMEKNLRWLLQSLTPAWDPLRGRIIVIGTPQHQRCMVEVLSDMAGWTHMRIPAANDAMTEAAWPEWLSIEHLKTEKAALESIGRVSSFYREFMCRVIGDEDQLFKKEYLKYYEGHLFHRQGYAFLKLTSINGEKIDPPEVRPVTIFGGVDPASSVSQSADYSTIVTVAVDAHMNRFVLPYYRRRVTPMILADAILDVHSKYKHQKMRIESTGYQEMLREYVRSKRHIVGLEIKETPRTSKSRRLEAMQPFFYQGKMHIQVGMTELEDELLIFPRGLHDDLLDALFYAMKMNFPPMHGSPNDIIEEDVYANPNHWLLAGS